MRRVTTGIAAIGIMLVLLSAPPAFSFSTASHAQLDELGLSADVAGTATERFVTLPVVDILSGQTSYMDDELAQAGDDSKHFDDCDFAGAGGWIRSQFRHQ